MSRVIVATRQIEKFNLDDLRRFGEVVRLDVDGVYPDNADEVIPDLMRKLSALKPTGNDYIALVGDPVHMAAVAAYVGYTKMSVRLLRYDKKFGHYYPVQVI